MKKIKPKAPWEDWQRVWDKFQETINQEGFDNSMGDWNYLIGRYIFENTKYNEEEFTNTIGQYLKTKIPNAS